MYQSNKNYRKKTIIINNNVYVCTQKKIKQIYIYSYFKFLLMWIKQNQQQPYQPLLSQYMRTINISELVKTMLSQKDSILLLSEYQYKSYDKKKMEIRFQQNKIQKFCSDFTIEELIRMKGKKNHVNPDLKKMIRHKLLDQQISNNTRKILWLQFTAIKQQTNFYQTIKKIKIDDYFQKIIQLDLNRTKGSKQNLQIAFDALLTIAKYNPYVGYCQGMNFIISFLIQNGFNQQETFFIWKYISQDIVPLDYYTNMISMFTDKTILVQMLKYYCPKVYQKIKTLDNDATSVTFSWFICLFAKSEINKQISKLIWDFLIVEGLTAILKAALVFFSLIQEVFLKYNDFGDIIVKIEEKIPKINNLDIFRKGMKNIYINNRVLQLCRISLNQKYQKQMLTTKTNKKAKSVLCKYDSHICVQVLENNKLISSPYNCFIFKRKNQLNIIDQYLDHIESKYYFHRKKTNRQEDLLMIGRLPHQCSKNIKQQQNRTSQNSTNGTEKGKSPKIVEVQKTLERNQSLQRSESMAFLKLMMQNPSFHNLLQIDEEQ